MTAEKTDLQKLEALLHSATNERQRKMYQSLLTKAQALSISSDSAQTTHEFEKSSSPASSSVEQQTTQSLTKKNNPKASTHNKFRGKSSTNKAVSVNNSTKKSVASNNSTLKSQSVKEKKSIVSNANSVTEIKQHQETKTGVKAEAKKQSKNKTHQDSDVDKAKTTETHQSNKNHASSQPASSSTEPAIFQAVGILKGIPCLEDEELFVKIDEQKYRVEKKVEASRRQINLLKSNLEQNGSREMLLRVYPNVSYNPKNKTPNHLFRLIRSYIYEEQHDQYREGFTIRGIWRHIPHGDNTVITIHRNIARLEAFKQLPRNVKKPYVKAHDLPVIWENAPVEPFVYHPERADSEQMPCYFVQVRAAFKDGLYIVEEMLEEPTRKIPKYIRHIRRLRKNPKSRQNATKTVSESNKQSIS
ncbi:MAG: hypothetical protein WBM44_28780 [Waterburya sp.]